MARGRAAQSEGTADSVVPSENAPGRQRACISCSIIKSQQQFLTFGCENCPFMNLEDDRERVGACTTNAFTGCYALFTPKQSWVAKWQRVQTFIPGAYAISIEAEIPDDILEQLEENGIRPHRILATALKDKDK